MSEYYVYYTAVDLTRSQLLVVNVYNMSYPLQFFQVVFDVFNLKNT